MWDVLKSNKDYVMQKTKKNVDANDGFILKSHFYMGQF